MATDTLVMVEHNGLAKVRKTSVSDNTPKEAGFIPLLDNTGRINNALLEDTVSTSIGIRWSDGDNKYIIANGSSGKGPGNEFIVNKKDAMTPWSDGLPVIYGFKDNRTYGVRVDAARNADTLSEVELNNTDNSDANKIVRTSDNGFIKTKGIYLNNSINADSSNDIDAFLYTDTNNSIKKSRVSDLRKIINLDTYYYDIDLSDLDVNRMYPVEFTAENISFIMTIPDDKSFTLKIDAIIANSNISSPTTIVSVNQNSRAYVSKIVNTVASKKLSVYTKGGYIYRIFNLDRNSLNKGNIVTSTTELTNTYLPSGNWFINGDCTIVPTTIESFIRTTHPSYSISGYGNSKNYDGNSTNVAKADHNHYYNVNDIKIQPFDNNTCFYLYGRGNSVIFRTDGAKALNNNLGAHPFIWTYNGEAAGNRLMYLTYNGDLYPTRCFNAVYADLAECFIPEDKNINMYKTYPNRIAEITKSEEVRLAEENSNTCIGVISNTYGLVLNGTQEDIDNGVKVPIAMCGTVYVEAEDITKGLIGNYVCSGKEGKARVTFSKDNSIGKIIGFKNNMYKILVSI